MACQQCHALTDAEGEGKVVVGWCGYDVHVSCVPLHVRTCRACWPHNTAYILMDDQRQGAMDYQRKGNV